MPQIRPIKDLRNTTEISKLCHELNEPIFITKNGYGNMVIMSIEEYEKLMNRIELYEKLRVAENQVKYGSHMQDSKEVFKRLRDKYEPK